MPQAVRPLSPFLDVYRWSITMALSIIHRATGIALAVGTILLVALLVGIAGGAESYATVRHFCGSWFGLILLFGWSWALCFHLSNGIRHLFWDAGAGFEKSRAAATGWAVVAVSLVATALLWACVMAQGSAA
jgi:succinate dehydrogenase / fumarate reductase, cytochrome b subunit